MLSNMLSDYGKKQRMVINKISGITTGMGIIQYFISLFEANEFVSAKHKMTDEVIAVKISKEFPDRLSAQDFKDNKDKKTVNSYRYRYNAGKFTKDIPPATLSFRYNKDGSPVNYKTGTMFLHQEEVEEYKSLHKLSRETKLRSML